jgi:hypothetical protein
MFPPEQPANDCADLSEKQIAGVCPSRFTVLRGEQRPQLRCSTFQLDPTAFLRDQPANDTLPQRLRWAPTAHAVMEGVGFLLGEGPGPVSKDDGLVEMEIIF